MAYFLGHHWAYRREAGESQLTFNYCAAFARFLNNFTFGRGVKFTTDKATEHIIPGLLKRVWEVDNKKGPLLYDIGQLGGVCGDVFIKVAYDPAWTDGAKNDHPGRVRILAINPAFAFPEMHPHDPERLIRFKLKYRFWATSTEGTRAVYTYTEIITDDWIEEFINDELIDSRKNSLGMIPVVQIQNISVPGSPWGLADIADILGLNREYNEQMTNIADIVNYHAAPTTLVYNAKISNLEKGYNKVWGGLPKDARVEYLENGVDLEQPLIYINMLKTSMHEMVGVPESALGQTQPVSNTSGVALAIQYQATMLRWHYKTTQYGAKFDKINEIVLRTLFLFEPETLVYNPDLEGLKTEPDEFQANALDPTDPSIYRTYCEWPPPLPVDILVLLNEVQVKMSMGLMSKRGALKALGEEFPADVLAEIFDEQLDEAKFQGTLDLLKSRISAAIIQATGIPPLGAEVPPPAPQDAGPGGAPQPGGILPGVPGVATPSGDTQQIYNELVTLSQGTKLAQLRNPDTDFDQET